MNIGYIGAGNLACALAEGTSKNVSGNGNSFFAYDINPQGISRISAFGVTGVKSIKELADKCEMIVLAVKPKDLPAMLKANGPAFSENGCFLVSVAAGTEISTIASSLGYDAKIARIMPNINARVGGAVTACCFNKNVSENEKEALKAFCASFGEVFEIGEELFSIFGVIGGCSPAFTYMYVDALARAAVKLGMNKALALRISAAAVTGSAKLVKESDDHPWELVDKVCSPGGTTIEGVAKLKELGLEHAVDAAVKASYDKDLLMKSKK